MHWLYDLAAGPLAWFAFGVFFVGLAIRFVHLLWLTAAKDPMPLNYFSFKYGFRSIAMWLVPYVARSWRRHPFLTAATFTFHICIFLVPVFLQAHVVLLNESFGLRLWELPSDLADVLTLLVIACCVFFLARRLRLPEVRYVTTAGDFVLLALVGLPFLTGILAYYQLFDYTFLVLAHILLSEAALVAVPFTRLSHMLLAPMIRAYMGSEFGGQRHAKDW